MISEEIKRLLDSDLEDDNKVGWELVKATGVSYQDVVDYVENSKVVVRTEQRYIWNGVEFIKNPNLTEPLYGATSSSVQWPVFGGTGISSSYPTWHTSQTGTATASSIGNGNYFRLSSWIPEYTSQWKEQYKAQRDAEIQEKEGVDIPGKIYSYIKNACISIGRRLSNRSKFTGGDEDKAQEDIRK